MRATRTTLVIEHSPAQRDRALAGAPPRSQWLRALRSRLSVKVIGTVVLTAGVLFVPYLAWTTAEARNRMESVHLERAIAVGRALDASIRTTEEWSDVTLLDASIQKMMWLDPEIVGIDVTAPRSGVPSIRTSDDFDQIGQPADSLSPDVRRLDEIRHDFIETQGKRNLRVVTPVHIARETVGTFVIELTLERVDALIANDIRSRTIVFLLAIGLFSLLIDRILRLFVLRPVQGIDQGVALVAQGQFDRPVEIDGPDELGRLGHAFNDMLGDLRRARDGLTKANAQLEATAADLRQQNSLRRSLHNTAVQLMNRRAVPEVLAQVVASAAALCNTEHGFVYLRDRSGSEDEIELKVGLGVFEAFVGYRKWVGEGIGGIVCATGETLVVSDHDRWPQRTSSQYEAGAFFSCIGVPLKVGDEVRGAIGIAFSEEGRDFDQDEIMVMERFAELASLALDNAELHASAVGELNERRAAETALQRERELLAQRVEERTKELQRSNEALESAMRSRDEFLAGMSHELRTPLTAILGLSQVLAEGSQGALNEQQATFLGMIEDSGRHLLSLINDVLDIAKIEAGRLELTVAPLEAEELCRDSLRLVAQSAEEKSHTLDLVVDPEVTILHGDELRLRQILVNLLSNAVKFTPPEGTIHLRVQGDAAGGQVHFRVEDNGVGIESEHLPMLFQPFTQLDSSLSRRHAGTGLGLALVARFAEMHQGSVTVESTPDEGSCFTVTLPWNPTGGATEDLASPAMGQGHQGAHGGVGTETTDTVKVSPTRLLLVEDNEATIAALTEYLPLCDYSIEVARNGHLALAALARTRPDLIVMDIQMTEMDGLEAIAHVRSDPTFEHIPIIALTALAMPGDRERCYSAGANRYLRKPIRMEVLDRTIRELLSQSATD